MGDGTPVRALLIHQRYVFFWYCTFLLAVALATTIRCRFLCWTFRLACMLSEHCSRVFRDSWYTAEVTVATTEAHLCWRVVQYCANHGKSKIYTICLFTMFTHRQVRSFESAVRRSTSRSRELMEITDFFVNHWGFHLYAAEGCCCSWGKRTWGVGTVVMVPCLHQIYQHWTWRNQSQTCT